MMEVQRGQPEKVTVTEEDWERIEPNSPQQRAVVDIMEVRLAKHFRLMGIVLRHETAREIVIDLWRVARKFG